MSGSRSSRNLEQQQQQRQQHRQQQEQQGHRNDFVPPEPFFKYNKKHRALQTPCIGQFEAWSNQGCGYDQLVATLEDHVTNVWSMTCAHDMKTELRLILGVGTDQEARDLVWQACREGFERKEENGFLPFSSISGDNTHVWDKGYFDGGTNWNDLRETADINGVLKHQPWAVYNPRVGPTSWSRAQYNAGIEWPDYLPNFANCELNAVNCCWVQDVVAEGNGDGDCEVPYDENCVNANPMDNTDVCYVDMSRSPTSNRVRSGFALYETEAEDDTHCHGFAWSSDANDVTSVFKGNTLFFVSMWDHMQDRGYVKNVPGAPMCACIEQMPTVTRTDCSTVDLSVMWVGFRFYPNVGFDFEIGYTEVNFRDCDGIGGVTDDLDAHYRKLVQEGKATQEDYDDLVDEFLVGDGNCESAQVNFLESQWLLPKNSVSLINDASERQIYADMGSNYERGVGANTYAAGSYEGDWGFRSVACPKKATKRCYLIINYTSQRRLFAKNDMEGSNGVGASNGKIYDDQKWQLESVPCSNGRGSCYSILNALSGRRLYADRGLSGKDGFGASSGDDKKDSMNWRIDGIDGFKTK